MRLGINCLSVDHNYAGGINSFVLGLLGGFARLDCDHSFQIFVTTQNEHLFQAWRDQPNFEFVVIDGRLLAGRKILRRAGLYLGSREAYRLICNALFNDIVQMFDDRCDLLYTPTTVLLSYNSKIPNVLSMHDIQQFHFPHFFTGNELHIRSITFPLSAYYSTHFQASSHFLKQDLISHFDCLAESKVTVIPEGVDIETFSERQNLSCLQKYNLPNRFLFFPAQLWPHKNHITVLQALHQIEQVHRLRVPLVLTGASYSAAKPIDEFISRHSMDYVYYLGKVPFQEIKALYQKAAFMITAVLYESSSLPILEAAAAGTPVIASRTRPNEEIGSVLKLELFEPENVDELAELILKLWFDSERAQEQVKYNSQHVAHYSWQNAARKYLNLFARIVAA